MLKGPFWGKDRKMGHGFLGGEKLEYYVFFVKGSIPYQNTGHNTPRLLYLCTLSSGPNNNIIRI